MFSPSFFLLQLKVYSLFKQATEGDVTGSQPWAVQMTKRAKWDAWNAHKGMSKEDAMRAYIAELIGDPPMRSTSAIEPRPRISSTARSNESKRNWAGYDHLFAICACLALTILGRYVTGLGLLLSRQWQTRSIIYKCS